MKKNIHPLVYESIIRCACGKEYQTSSTSKEMKVEICSACHPFYTGQYKIVDTSGRIDKFKKKYKL